MPVAGAVFHDTVGTDVLGRRQALLELAMVSPTATNGRGDVAYLLGHDLVRNSLSNKALSGKGASLFDHIGVPDGPLRKWYESLMVTNEGAVHAKLKSASARHFGPGNVLANRVLLTDLVNERYQELRQDGGGDLMASLGAVSTCWMARIVGLPDEDLDDILHWVHQLEGFSRMGSSSLDQASAGISALLAYINELYTAREANPRADLLSDLINQDDGLGREEICSLIVNLVVISAEPVLSQLGCSLYVILSNPKALERAGLSAEALSATVRETMRLESSVVFADRMVVSPLEVDGRTLTPGTLVFCCLMTANRDPSVWGDDADQFRPERFLEPNVPRLLVFGGGVHHCIGSAFVQQFLEEIFLQMSITPARLSVPVPDLEWINILGARPRTLTVSI